MSSDGSVTISFSAIRKRKKARRQEMRRALLRCEMPVSRQWLK